MKRLPGKQFVQRSLDWLYANLDQFHPDESAGNWKVKACIELAIASFHIKQCPDFSNDRRISEFLEFLLEVYSEPIFHEHLFRSDDPLISYGHIAFVLHATGMLVDRHEMLAIERMIAWTNVQTSERLPYRMLELRYLMELGGFKYKSRSELTLYRNTMLARGTNLVYVSNEDTYNITHTVFFLSCFGSRSISILSGSQRQKALNLIEHLLALYICKSNWDLVGELLLTHSYLEGEVTEISEYGWALFVKAQWETGALPGPHYANSGSSHPNSQDDREYIFKSCYHTTLVAALASTTGILV